MSSNAIPLFSAIIFFSAGAIGLGFIAINALRQAFKFEWKTLLGGTVLGIVNYYSIYLLLKALQYKGFESSTLFTINNVSIVMLSTLVGLILFKEQLSPKNWIGIALAVVSILLIAIA